MAFSDLKPYVGQLSGSEQEDLVAQLRERSSGPPTNAAEIYRDVNLRALQRFCGGHRELSEDVAEAEVGGEKLQIHTLIVAINIFRWQIWWQGGVLFNPWCPTCFQRICDLQTATWFSLLICSGTSGARLGPASTF